MPFIGIIEMLYHVGMPTEHLDGLQLCRDAVGQWRDVRYEVLYGVDMLSDQPKSQDFAKINLKCCICCIVYEYPQMGGSFAEI